MNSNHRVLEPYDLWKGKLTLEFVARQLRNATRHELTCHTEPRASYEFRCRTYGSLNISHMIKELILSEPLSLNNSVE